LVGTDVSEVLAAHISLPRQFGEESYFLFTHTDLRMQQWVLILCSESTFLSNVSGFSNEDNFIGRFPGFARLSIWLEQYVEEVYVALVE
jgi:hypothetical protein